MKSAMEERLHQQGNLDMLMEKERQRRAAKTLQKPPKEEEEGGIKPLRLAFGAMSLVVGVQFICLFNIVSNLFIMGVCTSVGSIKLVGIEIPPWKQVVGATWALVGMPIIIQGGVGALYRVQGPVMNYFFYLVATCALDMAFLITLFYEADMCTSVVPTEFVKMGSHFVCGLTDSALFLGFLFGGLVFLYFCFVVWSCAQEISGWKPALIQKEPEEPEYDEEEYRAPTPMVAQQSFPMPTNTYGGMPSGGFYGSMGQPDTGKGNWKAMSSLPGAAIPDGGPAKISKAYTEPSYD